MLGRAGIERVYVDGGFLISSFLSEGLIDDLLLTKVPLLLGRGLPLFHSIPRQTKLDLINVEAVPSGMVNLRYKCTTIWRERLVSAPTDSLSTSNS